MSGQLTHWQIRAGPTGPTCETGKRADMGAQLAAMFARRAADDSLARHAAPLPNLEAFEERAAIIEYDGGVSRAEAERQAAQAQGFETAAALRGALRT